jgi:hypothetical protein
MIDPSLAKEFAKPDPWPDATAHNAECIRREIDDLVIEAVLADARAAALIEQGVTHEKNSRQG